jgi:hypothetical protein
VAQSAALDSLSYTTDLMLQSNTGAVTVSRRYLPLRIALPNSRHSLETVFATMLVPAGLLSTNITFGLPVPETMPFVFLAVGIAYLLVRRSIQLQGAAIAALIIGGYGFMGVLGYAPFDGVRVLTGAAVFLVALQLCAHRAIVSRACEVSIYILIALRLISLVAPGPMIALYDVLGLRYAALNGGAGAILFAEPSYLASAVFAMWAIAKSGRQEAQTKFSKLDLYAALTLVLSGSASAALYACAGIAILVRDRWRPILAFGLSLAVVTMSFAAFEATRIGGFVKAAGSLAEQTSIEDAVSAFSLLDPSAAFRLSMGFVAISAGLREPFGHLRLEMSGDTDYVESIDTYGVLSSNQLIDEFYGNLVANSVPLQMLYFGGFPMLIVLMVVVFIAAWRLWRSRKRDANYLLVLVALASGCLVQSVMNSPFFYMAIAFGLGATARTGHAVSSK